MKPNITAYSMRMVVIFGTYTAALFLINGLDSQAYPLWQRIALSFLPVVPAAATIPVMVSFVRSMDEVWQRIITESALIAAGIVGVGTFTLGFLESTMALPDGMMIWVWPAMLMIHGLCTPFVQRRYA